MAEGEEPGDYISQRKDIHDCFFLVGTKNKERISTVKYFLANYSSYFRAMLLETDMKEKNSKEDIPIPDHEPDVFKLMLSYAYGRHDITFTNINQAMRFHILADKCLMPKLKKISAEYLVKNCTSNLCEVLECAVLLEIKEMESRAKKIVENDTRALLSSPDFLDAHPAIVEFIVKQEGLQVTEVELWRAIVGWAKRQCGNRSEGSVLRKKINYIMKHVQFLKMSLKEFAENVVPTSILTPAETIAVFVKRATGKGNTLHEAPSKTRQEWTMPMSCVATFPSDGNIGNLNNSYAGECEYKIVNLTTSILRISSLQIHISSMIPSPSCPYHVRLTSEDNRSVLASKKFERSDVDVFDDIDEYGDHHISSGGFELPGDFIMQASKIYFFEIQFRNGSFYESNPRRTGPFNGLIIKADVNNPYCSVELVKSRFRTQFNGNDRRLSSLVKSFTFLRVN